MQCTCSQDSGKSHLRHSVASFALITREREGRRQWLAQWNSNWQRFNFIGGHKRADETFRECIVRELEEETGLQDGINILVAAEPAAHLEFSAFSHHANTVTEYTFELFPTKLTSSAGIMKVAADGLNYWLNEDEIKSQQTKDGRQVSDTMGTILQKVGLTN